MNVEKLKKTRLVPFWVLAAMVFCMFFNRVDADNRGSTDEGLWLSDKVDGLDSYEWVTNHDHGSLPWAGLSFVFLTCEKWQALPSTDDIEFSDAKLLLTRIFKEPYSFNILSGSCIEKAPKNSPPFSFSGVSFLFTDFT